MKRFIAIFSLIVMMITAIQPVIAMHFCSDELKSLQIYRSDNIQKSCCGNTEHHDNTISGKSCCETEMMKLTTDKYQTISGQTITRITPLSIDIAGLTLVNLVNESDPDCNTLITTLKFPSKGHYLEDVSILTYICIYRI